MKNDTGLQRNLLNVFLDAFKPVHGKIEVIDRVQYRVMNLILVSLILFCLMIIPIAVFWAEARFRLIGVMITLTGATGLCLYLLRKGRFRLSRNLLLTGILGVIFWSTLTSGGISSPSIASLFIVVLVAGLLLSLRTGLVVFTISLIWAGFLTVIDYYQLLPAAQVEHTIFTKLIIYSVLLIFMMILVWVFANTLHRYVIQLTDETHRRGEAESELLLVLNSIDSAVVVVSETGEIIQENQVFRETFNPGSVVRLISELFPVFADGSLIGQTAATSRQFDLTEPVNDRFFTVSVKPFRFRQQQARLLTISDITEIKKLGDEQAKLLDRLRRQRMALMKLTFSPQLRDGNVESVSRSITESTSSVVRADRVSVWLGDVSTGQLLCVDLFDRQSQLHESGFELRSDDFPRYFQALERSRVIDATDAAGDARTRELAVSYLQPNGILSLLDAGIRVTGKLEGVICIESRSRREWTPDEIRFAGEMADYMAQTILSHQRRAADLALKMSEQRYKFLVERLPESAIMLYNQDLRFLLVDGPEIEANGMKKEELMGRTLYELFPPDLVALFEPNMRYVFSGKPHSAELAFQDKWYLYHYVPITDDQNEVVYGMLVARNITSKRKAQEDLSRSEEKYRRLFREDLSANIILTADGKLVDANPSYLKMFGFDDLKTAKTVHFSTLFRTTSVWKDILNALSREGRLEYLENEMVRQDGKTVYAVTSFILTKNSAGQVSEIKGYLLDDSKRRELEHQLVQSQKLQSIGTLAGGIAHDFNNLLAIILGRAQMLENRVQSDPRLLRDAQIIHQAAERGTGMVRQLLTFARKSETRAEKIDITDILLDIEKIIRETFPKNITFHSEYTGKMPVIQGDSTQLYQVFLNLCVNSRDAMPGGGHLSVTTSVLDGDSLNQRIRNAIAKSYVQVVVSDSGMGIPSNVINRIFEPFFTTKDIGKGTGLGLSVAYGIITAHRGFIEVDSVAGKGTSFTIYLPVEEVVSTVQGMEVTTVTEVRGGNETILLVEDEEMLRDLVMEVLISKGYHVLSAFNSVEAIDLIQNRKEPIDLILSDYGLPVMNGGQLHDYLKNILPSVPFILASGYIDPDERQALEKQGITAFIEKPYRPEELASVIRTRLDRRKS
ncbi:MAG: PAS domain S-box protein [Bacteroidetes bacterium]|nr:PAS domain S-box protein [Bacteroidota bacterium]